MTIVHEAFRGDDGSAGVLLRADSATGTRFLTCFVEPDDTVYRVAIRIVHPGRPGAWTSLEMADHVGGTIATLGAREVAPGSIPSYGDVLVVEEMIAGGQDTFSWQRLDESTLGALPASVERGADGAVVVTDWAGALSYRVADLPSALRGTSRDVATHAEAWVRGPGSR